MPAPSGTVITVTKDGKETKSYCDGCSKCDGVRLVDRGSGITGFEQDENCYHGKNMPEGAMMSGHAFECTGGKFFYAGRILKENSEEHHFVLFQASGK